jgi:mRNA interferase MazF
VVAEPWIPDRGDVLWLTFDPTLGHEQAGRRPALVLSPAAYNARVGLALVCPVTSRAKGYPFEVPLPAGLDVRGAIISDQVRCLAWQKRQPRLICSVPFETVEAVLQRLGTLVNP